ncbi:MAG: glycosyltransferase family 2 protein [Actinomycetota bacterium]|nr:glycosyltransferase family 2 protein [Actinomycetota bacterium]
MFEDAQGAPDVDVVMPVRDEAMHLEAAIAAIAAQDYAGNVRIHLAVAPSSDGTEELAQQLAAADPMISVVPNPTGTAPAGLNAAIAASSAPVIVRVDGHCELSPGYIARAVDTLARTGAANVGGIQRPVGTTPFERAVAVAMSSRFGTGGSRFHVGGPEGQVDTVYLGVFRREALAGIGGFDERLVRNQDYELNIRLRKAGSVVWFDPHLWADYRPRSLLRSLARQYFGYGRHKRHVLRRHPSSLKLRQAIPPLVCTVVAGGVVLAPWRRPALLAPAGYLAALTAATVVEGRRHSGIRLRLALALATIHFSWSAGLILGGRRDPSRSRR